MKLESLPEPEATALAVEYNLVSPFTNFLAVLERAESEKSGGLPQLRTVEHNIPRGWGGMGMSDMPLFSMTSPSMVSYLRDSTLDHELNEQPDTVQSASTWTETLLARAIPAIRSHPDMEVTFDMLAVWGVPEDILDMLRDYLANTVDDATPSTTAITVVALRLVLVTAKNSELVSRDDLRVLRKRVGRVPTDMEFERIIEHFMNE
jgi:hypothetical protein